MAKFGYTLFVIGCTLVVSGLMGAGTIVHSSYGGKIESVTILGHEYITMLGDNSNGASIIHSHSCKCIKKETKKVLCKCGEQCQCKNCTCNELDL